MTQTKNQKQTLQMSKQPPKAEQKLRTRIPKKNEEIQVKQTQTICTNIRNSLVSHNYNDIATQNKTKHCTDEGKSVTTQTNASQLHPHSMAIIIINVIFMITTAMNRLNHAAISFQGKVEVQSQFE